MTEDQHRLQDLLLKQSQPIAPHVLDDGRRVWVRRLNRGNPRLYYWLQTLIATKIIHVPPLRAVFRSPQGAIEDEANRLRALAEADICAPRLMAQLPDGLMMTDLSATHERSATLDALLREKHTSGKPVLPLWSAGLDALNAVHNKAQYLSQAFARNIMLLDATQWAFIDFEEDPIHYLNLAQCQVRDVLFYLHSTVFLLDEKEAAAKHFNTMMQRANSALQREFQRNADKLMRFNRGHVIGKLGRDGRRIAQALDFIAQTECIET